MSLDRNTFDFALFTVANLAAAAAAAADAAVFSFDVALVDYEMPDYEMSSAASDVLCAAFNESNGVYMADSGTHFTHLCCEASAATYSTLRSSH